MAVLCLARYNSNIHSSFKKEGEATVIAMSYIIIVLFVVMGILIAITTVDSPLAKLYGTMILSFAQHVILAGILCIWYLPKVMYSYIALYMMKYISGL